MVCKASRPHGFPELVPGRTNSILCTDSHMRREGGGVGERERREDARGLEGTGGEGRLFTCGAETVKNKWLAIKTLHTDRPFSMVWESMSTVHAVIIVQTQVKG